MTNALHDHVELTMSHLLEERRLHHLLQLSFNLAEPGRAAWNLILPVLMMDQRPAWSEVLHSTRDLQRFLVVVPASISALANLKNWSIDGLISVLSELAMRHDLAPSDVDRLVVGSLLGRSCRLSAAAVCMVLGEEQSIERMKSAVDEVKLLHMVN